MSSARSEEEPRGKKRSREQLNKETITMTPIKGSTTKLMVKLPTSEKSQPTSQPIKEIALPPTPKPPESAPASTPQAASAFNNFMSRLAALECRLAQVERENIQLRKELNELHENKITSTTSTKLSYFT